MPDQLQTIVQRMIDAGEPEENIATVIQHFKAPAVSTGSPLTHKVATDAHPLSDSDEAPSLPDRVSNAIEPLAHPTSAGDFLSLLVPSAVGIGTSNAAKMARDAGGIIRTAAQDTPKSKLQFLPSLVKNIASEVRQRAWGPDTATRTAQRTFNDMPLAQQMDYLPESGVVPETARAGMPVVEQTRFNDMPLAQQMAHLPETPAPVPSHVPSPPAIQQPNFNDLPLYRQMEYIATEGRGPIEPGGRSAGAPYRVSPPSPASVAAVEQTGSAAAEAPSAIDAATRARLQREGYSPEFIADLERRAGRQAPAAAANIIKTSAEAPPMEPVASHLQEPRVERGAERVGREQGLTKEQVRQQTAPILGEEQGAASPIFPKNVLTSIIDKMRTIPPGPEREAYVQAATSGKAQWQVENIRRTLEHLGLIAPPVAVMAPSIRDALLRQMSTRDQ